MSNRSAPKRRQRHSYQKVTDSRKRPIRGLWKRNGSYVARITEEDDSGRKFLRWVPLPDAKTPAQANEALRDLLVARKRCQLPVLKQTPKFADYVGEYIQAIASQKTPLTVYKEKLSLKKWVDFMGEMRLATIKPRTINAFVEKRAAQGMTGRTLRLDLIALRNVLKRALTEDLIKIDPISRINLTRFNKPRKPRRLYSVEEIEMICEVSIRVSKNGQQLADYLRLMAFSGLRRNETLALKWEDLDLEMRQIKVTGKYGKHRVIDFNPSLECHLEKMRSRRAPDSLWLFPSPLRGDSDIPARTFRESLKTSKETAAERCPQLNDFTFHDCRHCFISSCVMSGIDFMTISRWVGHADGGVLIGKVYGHLSDEHRKRQANRIVFRPSILREAK